MVKVNWDVVESHFGKQPELSTDGCERIAVEVYRQCLRLPAKGQSKAFASSNGIHSPGEGSIIKK